MDLEDWGRREMEGRIDSVVKEFNRDVLRKNPSLLTRSASEFFESYRPEPDLELVRIAYELLFRGWLLGMIHLDEGRRNDYADVDISLDMFDLVDEAALEFARSRLGMTREQFRGLSDDLKLHAFTVGRLTQLDMIEKVRQIYLKQLSSSQSSLEEFLKDVSELDGDRAGFGSYYETVYRTNLMKDYNAGKAYRMMQDPPVYLEFIGVDDERQSDICAARTGVIRPYTDPWWDDNWPPLHYNCRSTVREIFPEEAEALGLSPTALPNIEENDRIKEDVDGNRTVIKRNIPASGFGRNPAKDNAFWGTTPSQQERIARYMIQDEINGVAGKTVASDFSTEKMGYTNVPVSSGGVRYQNGLEKDTEFKNNLETARVLAEGVGYYVELRKAGWLNGNPQWDAWLNGIDKIEFKNPITKTTRGMAERITDGYKQASLVAVTVTSDEQLAAISGMLGGKDMARTLRTRTVKGLYVIRGKQSVFLSNADMKNPDVYNRILDNLKMR